MGNILNRSKATAFRVEVLEKLSGVRDTVNRKSLLHHVVSRCTRTCWGADFYPSSKKGAWSCSPTWATCCWSWRTSAWSPALTMRSFWPTSAEWRCFLHVLNYFDKHKVECRSSLGYLHLSHSYCSATRALITSFLEVLSNLQMFPHISHFLFTKPPHAPKRPLSIYFQNVIHAHLLSFCLRCFHYPYMYRKQWGICSLSGRQFDSWRWLCINMFARNIQYQYKYSICLPKTIQQQTF